jgi:WD40 repeat protein
MAVETRIGELLVRYEEACAQGQPPPSLQLLCADCPELVEDLRRFLQGVQRLRPLLASSDDAAGSLSPPAGEADLAAAHIAIPGYEILSELGRGGQSVVFQARRTELKRLVALKMILAGDYAGPKERTRFRVEAEAVARLQHPNIVQIHDIGEHNGRPYLALEYVAGGTLAQRIARQPLAPRQAAQLVETLARAVHCAHQHGIIHRDLKPSNILLERADQEAEALANASPKIADFGLAKRLDAAAGPTSTGDIMGTPSYMAPEQAAGRANDIGPSTDIYALGVILYESLAGRPPFRAETALETLQQVLTEEPVSLTRLRPGVPRDLETICLKCLQKEPRRRYPNADALAEDLRRYMDGRPIQARPVGTLEQLWRWCRRNPALATVGGLAVAALLGMLAFVVAYAFQQANAAAEIRLEQGKTLAALCRAERTNFDRNRDLGLSLCEQGEVAHGLLWLARALQSAPEEADDAVHAIRLNLAASRPRIRAIRSMLPNPNTANFEASLNRVVYSPDGVTIAAGRDNGTVVWLWDSVTGRLCGEPLRHPQALHGMAFHPNGTLVTGCEDRRIRFWDVTTGKLIGEPFSTEASVETIAVGPDGRTLLTCDGKEIQIWEVNPGKSLSWKRKVSAGPKFDVASLGSDGRFYVTVDEKRTGIQVHLTPTGQPVGPRLVVPLPLQIKSTILSPDGKTAVSILSPGGVRAWEPATGDKRFDLVNPGLVTTVAFSRDSQTILTGGQDATVRLWKADTGQPLGPSVHLRSPVWGAAFSPDGTSFATSGGIGDAVLVWEIGLKPDRVIPTPHLIGTVGFSPDGTTLATGGMRLPLGLQLALDLIQSRQLSAGEARLWNVATCEDRGLRLVHSKPVLSAAFSPDGRQCLLGSAFWGDDKSGEARLWDIGTGRQLQVPHGNNLGIPAVAFSPDGRTYVTGGKDRQACLWDAATRKCLRSFHHRDVLRAVAYNPRDGRTIVTGSDDETAQLWDADTGEKRGQALPHHAAVTSVAFSPDGKYVLTGCQDNLARIWNPDTVKIVRTFAHRGWVLAAVFSPDGRLVLTGSLDGTARLWDRATGLPVGPPVEHDKATFLGLELNWVPAVAFSPDGRTLVSGGTDQKARFRAVPRPLEGTPEQIMVSAEVVTGMTLDGDVVDFLNAAQWQERRQRLEELGGLPTIEQEITPLRK